MTHLLRALFAFVFLAFTAALTAASPHSGVTFKFGAAKSQFAMDEPITVICKITNHTSHAIVIDVSGGRFMIGITKGKGESFSRPVDASDDPVPQRIAAGTTYMVALDVNTVPDSGTSGVDVAYDSDRIDYHNTYHKIDRVPGWYYATAKMRFDIHVAGPSEANMTDAITETRSQYWDEVLDGLTEIAKANNEKYLPVVRALANHPSIDVRLKVIEILSKSNAALSPICPELKKLLYDPVLAVRQSAAEAVMIAATAPHPDRSVTLQLFALWTATKNSEKIGIILQNQNASAAYFPAISNEDDPRVGDLLADLPSINAAELNLLHQFVPHTGSAVRDDIVPSPYQIAGVVKDWQVQRNNVPGLFSEADLNREVAIANKSMFPGVDMTQDYTKLDQALWALKADEILLRATTKDADYLKDVWPDSGSAVSAVLNNSTVVAVPMSASLCKIISTRKVNEALYPLLNVVYRGTVQGPLGTIPDYKAEPLFEDAAAATVMQLDPVVAGPQIRHWHEVHPDGAN